MKIHKMAVLLLLLTLTGCVAAVVAGAAGVMVYDKRSFRVLERDTRIFHNVRTAIVTDPLFRYSHISVTSFNRAVLLVGQTSTDSLRVLAGRIAQKTPQVSRVYNQLTVEPSISLSVRAEDSWITSQVRSFMLTQKGLESGSIRVVTENKVVYLMGLVSHEQANLAADVARRVSGVRRVIKVFQYS